MGGTIAAMIRRDALAEKQSGPPFDFPGLVMPNPDHRRPQLDTEAPPDTPTVNPIPVRGWKVGPKKNLKPFDTTNPGRSKIVPELPLREF